MPLPSSRRSRSPPRSEIPSVSRPDGSGWYDHEELDATDRTQRAFSKTLPIRVWTKGTEFNIALARPLTMRGGVYEMRDAKVVLSQSGREDEVRVGARR